MEENKPKIGRPKLPKNEVRQPFTFRLSPNEEALFEAAAKTSGESLHDWMRNTLTRSAKRVTS